MTSLEIALDWCRRSKATIRWDDRGTCLVEVVLRGQVLRGEGADLRDAVGVLKLQLRPRRGLERIG
jgi:hypothetical protein